ncbi:MAG TPA: type II toxin-antitoxin system PemK/MazF family toxin [Tepidisphaeraceae bacterium]|nr:type II toxin-antitoxin system PemK/MazF family toxin [Tepidisphaeraceae bacterium]
MVIRRGDIWWAELPEPTGLEAGFRRPVVVVQEDALNQSRIQTIVVVPLYSTLKHLAHSANIELAVEATSLQRTSVAVTIQVFALNRSQLCERVGTVSLNYMDELDYALARTLGLLPV